MSEPQPPVEPVLADPEVPDFAGAVDSLSVLNRARDLAREGKAFALITVVRALAPTSGKPGDKAILTADGHWVGWVGGSCAEPAARRGALAALDDGQCRLIHLTNDESEPPRLGVERAAMSCYSGGTMELYVEPHLPQPELLVLGRSPVARELCRLGAALRYRVTPLEASEPAAPLTTASEPAAIGRELSAPERSFVVVASHGHGELEALDWALSQRAAYVGLVCSRRRHAAVCEALLARGVDASLVRSVDGPAGLDIGARGPEEVALSVLAEIVRRRRGAPLPKAASEPAPEVARSAAPVVSVAAAEPSCCGGQRAEAEREPQPQVERSCCGTGPRLVPTFSAVVLAAGLSRRMGQPNKLLLPVNGQPMICRSLEAVLGAGVQRLLVVLGHDAEAVAQAIAPLGVRTVHNPAFASGQVSSVRAGLAALGEPTDAVMVCLGDQPLLDSRDLLRLQRAFAERPTGDVLVPTHRGERGNPVVLGWQVVRETLARDANFGCRRFLDENTERVFFWDSGSEHFVRDVDRPADYRRLSTAVST